MYQLTKFSYISNKSLEFINMLICLMHIFSFKLSGEY